jgi:hypothetical protein
LDHFKKRFFDLRNQRQSSYLRLSVVSFSMYRLN